MKKPRILQLMIIFILLLIFDCRKKEEIPEKPTNLTATIISETEIDLSWSDNSTNEAGFRLERSKNGGTDWVAVTSTGKDVSSYKNTGLEAGTTYSFKVMAFNAVGNSEYSNIASGNTPAAIVLSPATLTTSAVTEITQNTAVSGGNISADGNSPILARGICWGTAANPTVQNSKTTDGGGTGSFTSSLTGLLPNTQYYVRSYATNSAGTAYGVQVTFTTLAPLPVAATLTTTEATLVTSFSAITGGNITSDGGAAITVRGLCWSTTENPTISNDTVRTGSGTGSFTRTLEGLSGNTTYYVRAYAINSAGTAYGTQVTFTTSAPSAYVPAITTVSGSNITATTVQTGGNITSDKGLPVIARGVCWNTSPAPSISNDTTKNGSGQGNFVSTIKNLTPNTKYYIRAWATNSQGTGYGDEITITTQTVVPPVATSADATSISGTSATLNGSVNANGTETAISFEYGTTFMYGSTAAATPASATGITPTSALAIITGLAPNTLYHFRIKAVSPGGTVYGDDLTFTTLALPTAVTLPATYVFKVSATLMGYVNGNGNTASIKFEYGTTSSYGASIAGIPDNTAIGGDVPSLINISGLTASTVYHYRIVAENKAGIVYGDDKTFQTLATDPVVATLTTAAITDITSTSATGGGNITSDGGVEVIARGICIGTSANPTVDDQKTSNGTGTGTFISAFTGLTPGTVYHVRAYAENLVGIAYGNDVTFTSAAPPADLPVIATVTTTDITSTTASSGGNISDDGGGAISIRGVCWSTEENPTTSDNKTENGNGTGTFASNITGLNPNTAYYVRAYAVNSAGTAYGNQETFMTSAPPAGMATLTTTSGSDITPSSFTTGGNITSDGGGAITERGVCYGTSANPTTAGTKTSDGTGAGVFVSVVSGLTPSTVYHVRAYAINSAGTAYGNDITVTTAAPAPVLPTVTTASVTAITHNSASGGGDVTNEGNATVTERGICWSTTTNPTTADSKLSIGTGSGTFTGSMTGLNFSTTYHVRAYAINSVGVAYGNDVSFTTTALPYTIPTITTTTVSTVTHNSASSGGESISDGGASIIAKGVCYGTTSAPTLADSYTTNGTGTSNFSSNLSGLASSTQYYVRAYATNAAGTGYGTSLPFTTSAPPIAEATLTTTSITGIGTTSASSGGNITYGGTSAVTARGVCWSTSANPTTANSHTTDGSGTGVFTSNLTGLTPCTLYHVRAYATNSTATSYGADITFTTASVLPTVSTTALTSPSSTSVSTGGTVSGNCGSTVTERGVCWGTSPNPTTATNKLTSGTGSGSYTINITGLTPCTTYYIRAYAINASGTNYATNELSFTTSSVTATISAASASGVTATAATVGGTVGGNCTTGATRGICYGTVATPDLGNSTVVNSGTGTGSFSINLTGLTPCTTYNYRAFVTNSSGTVYSSPTSSFTTGSAVASVTTTAVSSITATTAVSGGTPYGNCLSGITARGVVWNTTGSPTVDLATKTNHGAGSGAFTSTITGLTRLTTYYVRAYVTNASGTSYGNQYSFTTIAAVPTVSSSTISIYSGTEAMAGGNVSSDGGATITEYGMCWSSSTSAPTIADSKVYITGSISGTYSIKAAGLTPGTTYYLRAYATNSSGTGYGTTRTINTPGNVTDYDGNVYGTVYINGQTWMQSNLKVTHFNNGQSMWQASDTSQYGGYAYYHAYSDNADYVASYGYLYGGTVANSDVCPAGYHVPTYSEWSTLASNLGGASVAGTKMNDLARSLIRLYPSGFAYSYTYWNNSMTGHDNSSLFYGRGGGYYNYGYTGLKLNTRWWSSTTYRYVQINYDGNYLDGISPILTGVSDNANYIRCKKD